MLHVPDPLDLPATPDFLRHQARHGVFDGPVLRRAFALIGHTPAAQQWTTFLNFLLLVLGTGLLVSGAIFFFAFNWAGMHRFAKLGLIEGSIAIAIGLALWQGLSTLPGKIALSAAAGLVGALLAVFGQIYQTGADSYQLFALWSILISGWVLLSRFTPLWFSWLLLLNMTLWLGALETGGEQIGPTYAAMFALNALALAGWEWARTRGIAWLHSRWTPRLCASLALGALTSATLTVIFASQGELAGDSWLVGAAPLFVVVTVGLIYGYSQHLFDPFMLIITALAVCICLNSWLIRTLDFDDEAIIFLILGMLVIGETAGVVAWVRQRALRWEVNHP